MENFTSAFPNEWRLGQIELKEKLQKDNKSQVILVFESRLWSCVCFIKLTDCN